MLIFWQLVTVLKFMFSKKATKIDEIFTVDLSLFNICQIGVENFVNFFGPHRKHELYQGKANWNSTVICSTEKILTQWKWKITKRVCKKMKLVLVNISSFLNFQMETKKIKRSESSVPNLFGFFSWNSSKILIRRILGAYLCT